MKRAKTRHCRVVTGCVIAMFIAATLPVQTLAQSSREIYRLIDQGKLESARRKADSLLKATPEDAELLFARALIAEKSGKDQTAISLYRKIVELHPDMLEAYNNLAIHHAARGEYKKAIDILEQAMLADPAVATAYRNLTAIYAQLASAAYRKALDSEIPLKPLELASIDEMRTGPAPQPSLVASAEKFINNSLGVSAIASAIADDQAAGSGAGLQPAENGDSATTETSRNNVSGSGETQIAAASIAVDGAARGADGGGAVSAQSAAQSSRSAAIAGVPNSDDSAGSTAEQENTALIAQAKKPTPQLKSVEVASADDNVTREAALDIDAIPAKSKNTAKLGVAVKKPDSTDSRPVTVAAVKPSAAGRKLVEQNASEKQALIDHIKSWAVAWSDRDVERYLSHYSPDFKPRNNMSLEEWKKQRYGRLRWREFIVVKPSRYSIDLDGDRATVNFNQYYKSERFEDTIRKTLKLTKRNGRWLIVRELI